MKLDNKIALITGGASGMGKACVQMLAKAGMKVVVLDKQETTIPEAMLNIACDVSDAKAVENALEQILQKTGIPPALCVNCAGIAPAKRVVGREGPLALEEFKKVIDVNLIGTFNVMRVVAFAMSQSQPDPDTKERGVIINTASVAAYEGQIGQVAYSASKGGIVAMTLPAAREFAQFGIRVVTIAPGIMQTPMMAGMPEEVQQSLAEAVPFPKRLGYPEEFASLVMHITENCMINGEVIRLDGALRMQPK